jgi:hypothetical protein
MFASMYVQVTHTHTHTLLKKYMEIKSLYRRLLKSAINKESHW